jgi:phosphoglucomutase/phosphomannomutase
MTNTLNLNQFDATTQKNVVAWLNGPYDKETKTQIEKMVKENPQEIVDSFYTNLSFGTGGMRGLMGVGTNRMNSYTIKACTQGLANYINQQQKTEKEHSVVIGYDSRHHSREFAEECAKVLAANNIRVYIYKDIRPTPLVSFGCRYKKATSAIMITASHNPPQYNGYKVYWNDGAQVLPPNDQGIVDQVNKITDPSQVKTTTDIHNPLIVWLDESVDEAYLNAISDMQLCKQSNQTQGESLKVVYTSLHGTGITMAPAAMKRWGFSNVELVKDQVIPNGDFPTCPSPNPEERDALSLGIKTLLDVKGDILIATDPDADRVGAAIYHKGNVQLIDGNQMACLLLHHVLSNLEKQKRLPEKAAFVKTIVTSELFAEICKSYNKPCYNVLTGFKYIAEKIREWEATPNGNQYIFGGEESYGYLYNTLVRDKDAIICSVLICEMALQAKLENKTLIDVLHEIWKKHGTYIEKLISVKFEESKAGKEQMEKGMLKLQENPFKTIEGTDVLILEDYKKSESLDFKTGKKEKILLPKSEVLLFKLADGTKLVIRPSGTEPKIKIYCGVVEKNENNISDAIQKGEARATTLLNALKKHLMS